MVAAKGADKGGKNDKTAKGGKGGDKGGKGGATVSSNSATAALVKDAVRFSINYLHCYIALPFALFS